MTDKEKDKIGTCSKCGKKHNLLSVSNKNETVCDKCSWFWLTDEERCITIDPSTLHATRAQMDAHIEYFEKRGGFK